MGCNPVSMVDPLGLRAGLAPRDNLPNYGIPNAGVAYIEGQVVVLGAKFLNFAEWQARSDDRFNNFLTELFIQELIEGRSNASRSGNSEEATTFDINGKTYEMSHSSGFVRFSEVLENVVVKAGNADWIDWGKRMNLRYGRSFNYSFEGYGVGSSVSSKMPSLFSMNLMTAGNYSNASEMPKISIYKGAIVIKSSIVDGGAVALPPFIIIDPNESDVQGTLRHEYGHQLQSVITGLGAYYLFIGLPSIISADKSNNDYDYNHQEFYSEKSANQLSYWIHGKPADWDHYRYPVYTK